MNYKGAVFFDVDGTLVDERLKIFLPTDNVKAAIARLKEDGYLTALATGRARCYIPDTGIDFDCYITANGAVAQIGNTEICNSCMDTQSLKEILEYMESKNIPYEIETMQGCYYRKSGEDDIFRLLDVFNISRKNFAPYTDDIKLENLKVNKLMAAFGNIGEYDDLRRNFRDEFDILRHHGGYLSADINKKNINKSIGVSAVIKYCKIDISDSYAFGDDVNDAEMLSVVGHGIAMTPHAPELDTVAEYKTSGVGEDGICVGLRHFKLID